jgi:hypothetical protein
MKQREIRGKSRGFEKGWKSGLAKGRELVVEKGWIRR